MKSVPLYIHIPFCRSKCGYCTFYSCTDFNKNLQYNFIRELKNQIAEYMSLTGSSSCRTVYIGGGTPSLLPAAYLQDLLTFLGRYIDSNTEEFTIECNPEDVSEELLFILKNSNIDRISLGVQSFNDDVLKASGRISTAVSIDKAVQLINSQWKGRFSMDIISGLPGQTLDGQLNDIRRAVSSGVDHISCYSLIVEENTPVFESELLPDSESEDQMWKICRDYLLANHYVNYEVSNYCLTGCESLHNLEYWKMNEYIGCGPGAVSMISDDKGNILRISNPHNLQSWSAGETNNWSVKEEIISPADFIFETFMMGLRTKSGLDRNLFFRRFGSYPEILIQNVIESYKSGTFSITEEKLTLSDNARLFMNPLLLKIHEELCAVKIEIEVNWP